MGHYDSSYSLSDFNKLKQKSKTTYIKSFEEEFKMTGTVHRYYDDIEGWILREWANINNFKIEEGHNDITVTDNDSLLTLAKKCINEIQQSKKG